MYEYRRRTGKFKRIVVLFLLMATVSFLSIFIYNMYINIDVYSGKGKNETSSAIRLAQSVEAKEDTKDITQVLEGAIKCVVGISKIKNVGNSIFLNNSTQELGLGTGIVITENRIYTYKLP